MIKTGLFSAIFFLLMIGGLTGINAQISLQMPDTVIPRGSTVVLPVNGSIPGDAIREFKFIFSYNSKVIDIRSVRGGQAYALLCQPVTVTRKFDRLDSSTIEIYCDNIKADSSPLFEIEVEALSGEDSVSGLQPEKLFINGAEQSIAQATPGLIKVSGIAIFESFPEGLGTNSPNPFSYPYMTKFPFSINKTTSVRFDIYSNGGRQIASGLDEAVDINIFSVAVGSFVDPLSSLERGNYQLWLEIKQPWNFSSGMYYLVMKTDDGVYSKNFMLLK